MTEEPVPNRLQVAIAVLQERIEKMDRLYSSQLESIRVQFSLSLASMDKATAAAFAASEKAIIKAEDAQREYNSRSNEFRGALEDQNKLMGQSMVSRNEWESGHRTVLVKIDEIKGVQMTKADQAAVQAVSKLVYIGVGMAVLLSFLVPVLITILKTSK